jgi:hypothetical protein
MADLDQIDNKDLIITLKDLLNGTVPSPAELGPAKIPNTRRKDEVGPVEVSNARTDNQSKILIISAMIATVLIALLVGSYKYLNIGFHCIPAPSGARPATPSSQASHINCPYDLEQQKDAGALLQSIVSGVVGIVAGMGIGSRKQ